MSEDITSTLRLFRECIRQLWNVYFLEIATVAGPDVSDKFEQISFELFDVLVNDRLDETIERREELFKPPYIRIVPYHETGAAILINRPSNDRCNYWDDPVNHIGPFSADLQFIDFFDWDYTVSRDLQYYLVIIRRFPDHPELVGRRALIEVRATRAELTRDP